MQTIVTTTHFQANLEDILASDETLLWSGRPTYGNRFFQALGPERLYHFGFLFGAAIMWCTLPFINAEAQMGRSTAIWVYAATTIAFIAASVAMASNRQYVLSNLAYFITDKRAIVCRRGRNWRFATRLYLISFPHSETYPYSVLQNRPYPSLQIGTLLSQDQVQPFGYGLSHVGQPPLWGRHTMPVVFESVPNAQELLGLIKTNARQENAKEA